MPKTILACKNCKALTTEKKCPICGSANLTTNWKGLIHVIDPENSEIAKKLGIKSKGTFALEVV